MISDELIEKTFNVSTPVLVKVPAGNGIVMVLSVASIQPSAKSASVNAFKRSFQGKRHSRVTHH